ncbi:MAG: nuclear transport factor 2 family protein [Gammaproteobacteria bacterium]|nr:nuclear transport factor 2 family protein [Gammaproteobacteria bacterium]
MAKIITHYEDMWAHTACSSVPEALKAAFAEDFQGTAPNGQRYGRPTGNWGGNGTNLDCRLQKIQIRLFGDSVAVAYGNESSVSKQKDGRLLKHCLVWTDTWLMRKGKWQIVAAQDNRVTCQ